MIIELFSVYSRLEFFQEWQWPIELVFVARYFQLMNWNEWL
jgi:hypothetical protein